MIFAKTIPYGLDKSIKDLQSYMDNNLTAWSGTRHIYGLLQKTERNGKTYPEAYISGSTYKEVFIDDRIACSIGFIDNERETNPYWMANVDCIFTVKLTDIYPLATTRENELALIYAENVLKPFVREDTIKIKTGINDVFRGFDTDKIKHRDMHPWFVFSFNFDIIYDNNI
jgi:hypothetical protein